MIKKLYISIAETEKSIAFGREMPFKQYFWPLQRVKSIAFGVKKTNKQYKPMNDIEGSIAKKHGFAYRSNKSLL